MGEEDSKYQIAQAGAYCNHIRGLKLRMDTAEANYRESLSTMDGLKAVRYDREGGSTYMAAGDDAIAATIERIRRSGDRMAEDINAWVGECEQFDMLCRRLTPQSSYLLSMRYRNGCKWEDVAERMHYAPEYVRTALKDRALLEMYSVLPMSWK